MGDIGNVAEVQLGFPQTNAVGSLGEPAISFPASNATSAGVEGALVNFPRSNSVPGGSIEPFLDFPYANGITGGDLLIVIGKFVVGEQNTAGVVQGTKQLGAITSGKVINGNYAT
jgi:hypothetical protein